MKDLAPGSRLGAYTVERLLGRGGMGSVYAARDADGAPVALKVIKPEAASDAVYLERFRREAEAARVVVHPNVARCLGAGVEGGVPFLVLELVAGGSLEARGRTAGRLAWPEAARLGAQIARALAAIHAKGFVHRDVKPENVLVDERGVAKLTDFGIARRAGVGSLTNTGEFLGTPQFMAPEQAIAAKKVDGRADLYSLGAVLFTMLAGAPPFYGSALSVLQRLATVTPPRVASLVPGVPGELDALVARLLEKDPERRGDAAKAAEELEKIAAGAKVGRGRSVHGAALGVLLVLGASAFGLRSVIAERPAPPPPQAAPSTPVANNSTPAPRDWFARWQKDGRAPREVPGGLAVADSEGQYVHERTGLRFVWVPRARCTLGDSHGEAGRESPVHHVTVSDFFLGVHEVTNEQFDRFARETGHVTEAEEGDLGGYTFTRVFETGSGNVPPVAGLTRRKPHGPNGPSPPPDHPVVQVTWHDAVKFCEWVSRDVPGKWAVDLPSEAQWERAASWDAVAERARVRPWGDETDDECATLDPAGDRNVDALLKGPLRTRQVGSHPKNASPVGAFDMVGSVHEWCADFADEALYERRAAAGLEVEDPVTGGERGELFRIARGASSSSPWWYLTCYRRIPLLPHARYVDLGFRVAFVRRKPSWK